MSAEHSCDPLIRMSEKKGVCKGGRKQSCDPLIRMSVRRDSMSVYKICMSVYKIT